MSAVQADLGFFDAAFGSATGFAPMPWQRLLFERLIQARIPTSCHIPTGLGKTSVISIWLLAIARKHAALPRRLAYVVNRRTVVDQATREVERLRKAIIEKPELQNVAAALASLASRPTAQPLAISTLRGAFADNAEWRSDPARPAVVVGTVDMIGSRLLFSGYGRGFKTRPLDAGFLGQDTLLVHDEAHLEPAFQELIVAIEAEQRRCRDFRRLQVMELTATSRGGGRQFELTDADRKNAEVCKRIQARKRIAFHPTNTEKETATVVARQTLVHKDSESAILVFLRRLDHARDVAKKLREAKAAVQLLTGTLRGLERDALARTDPIFARFMPKPAVDPRSGTVFLVCTSAGEVGIDISADHMVCDLTPFDSMAQRLGRVNRFGTGDASIDIVYPAAFDPKDKLGVARERTLRLLRKLPNVDGSHDGSPDALSRLPAEEKLAAFTPSPAVRPATDILFDAWVLTSVRERVPGRPPVADWLHGIADWRPPETFVAWREEVEWLSHALVDRYPLDELLEDYPLKPHELLHDATTRVSKQLETIAARCPDLPAWVVGGDGEVRRFLLSKLVETNRQGEPFLDLANCTVVLPPSAGGLQDGMLSGEIAFDEAQRAPYDVADEWKDEQGEPRRRRIWDDAEPVSGMRLVRAIDVRPEAGEEAEEDQTPAPRYWRWFVRPRSADDVGSQTALQRQELGFHLQSAKDFAAAIADKLGLKHPESTAVALAAQWHDVGKRRAVWQYSIRNGDYPRQTLAKSGGKMWPLDLGGYRHEFGSLLDLAAMTEFVGLDAEVRELILHLVAAHHGRARPHFPPDEVFDHERPDTEALTIAAEVPRRFARLQRKYGRWGLAYLESIVRSADVMASEAVESTALREGSP